MRRYRHKWGFGMAPIKADVLAARQISVQRTLWQIDNTRTVNPYALEDLSIVKGLFNRCHRQDQWDWFTVWQQLGRPGRAISAETGEALFQLRCSLRDGDADRTVKIFASLRRSIAVRHMQGYLSGHHQEQQDGAGYIYILSTREQPGVLKIGYTERSVEARVKEINRATGLLIPYGARAVWTVQRARSVEADVHQLLSRYRIRSDREFFEVDFRVASRLIEELVTNGRQGSDPPSQLGRARQDPRRRA
jgi:hypothetical protein